MGILLANQVIQSIDAPFCSANLHNINAFLMTSQRKKYGTVMQRMAHNSSSAMMDIQNRILFTATLLSLVQKGRLFPS